MKSLPADEGPLDDGEAIEEFARLRALKPSKRRRFKSPLEETEAARDKRLAMQAMAYATKRRTERRQLQENGTLPPGFENYHGDGHETEHRGGNKKDVWESSDDGDGSEHFVAAGSLPPLAGPTTLAAPQAVMARAPMPPAPPQEVRPPAPLPQVNYIVASPPAVAEASADAEPPADVSAAETQDGFAPDGDMSTCWPHATQGVGGLVHEPGHNCYKFGYCTVTGLPWRALKPKRGEGLGGTLDAPRNTSSIRSHERNL